eukprot:2266563-Pyramimonas_sp.AAC.1
MIDVEAEHYSMVAPETGVLDLCVRLRSKTQTREWRDGEKPAREGEQVKQSRAHEVVGEGVRV